MENEVFAIDKLRSIVAWADWQNESFNSRVKSVSDLEKLFDYCASSDLVEFLDDFSYLEDEEYKKVKSEVKKLLGYNINL